MAMTTENIIIPQGADFTRIIALTDDNGEPLLTAGYSANASMKIDAYSTESNTYTFQTALANGQCTITMNANTTINISAGFYQYDVIIWSSSNGAYRIMEGIAEVDGGISIV
jgi:hypothetical protein